MQLSSVPYKFQYIWGAAASAPNYLTTPIPATTGSSVAASQNLGFPPDTANITGTPPDINDFNGVLQYVTAWAQWFQAGAALPYDATFQGYIGGYPNGAIVMSVASPPNLWQSTADNNASDPDTGGSNWQRYPQALVQAPAPYINATAGGFTETIPAGMTRGKLIVIGAGGAGGSCDGTHNAGGGGSGGTGIKYLTGLVPGQTIAGTVGAGGAPSAGVTGGSGSATTAQVNGVGTVYTAGGGSGGAGGSSNPAGGQGGAVTGCDINLPGGYGGDGAPLLVTSPAGDGAPGYLGMGAGRGASGGGTPANGSGIGAGGGGSYNTASLGGTAPAGAVIIEWSP